MALRWTAAGMFEAKKGFRRLKTYKQLPILKQALLDQCQNRQLDQVKGFPSAISVFHGKVGAEGSSGRGASMLIHLHKQATTTPKVRSAIQASDEPASVLAERYGTTEQTVYKWRHRDSVEDRSHTPHRLQTTLTPAQEAVWKLKFHVGKVALILPVGLVLRRIIPEKLL